jgi:hypothetical protein
MMFDPFSDKVRYAPSTEVAKIRAAIRQDAIGKRYGKYDRIRFGAYNRDEVDAIAALLTPEERALVTFTWWTWDEVSA